MKKILLSTVLLVCSVYGFSQKEKFNKNHSRFYYCKSLEDFAFQGVKYGVRAGYNISNLDFEDAPTMENKHRNSVYFGCFANIGLSRTISLVPELQFFCRRRK